MDYEEKMTDVNIAARLLTAAFENRFDTALLISADGDLTTPVRQVLAQFPQKRVVVAQRLISTRANADRNGRLSNVPTPPLIFVTASIFMP